MIDPLVQKFLKKNGWENATCQNLGFDASFRWYDRLNQNGKTALLMHAPAPENPAQFICVDQLLASAGLFPPKIWAQDLKNGLVLLEDFGDNTFTRLIQNGENETHLYMRAVDELIKLHQNCPNFPNDFPQFSPQLIQEEVSLLPLWFIKYVVGTEMSAAQLDDFIQIWEILSKKIIRSEQTLVLSDYHIDNLMITPDNRCGILDFQDAVKGPRHYDLISLVEDARRTISPALKKQMTDRYFTAFPQTKKTWDETFDLVAAERHTRIIGIFIRLCVRDKKPRYLQYIPHVWQLLESHLNNPALTDYKVWLDTHVPDIFRRNIPRITEETK